MMDYKYYAVEFCRELQQTEKEGYDVPLEVIQLIRRFKIELGYSIPESEEEGSGSKIRKVSKCDGSYVNKYKEALRKMSKEDFDKIEELL